MRLDEARELAAEARARAHEIGDPALLAETTLALAWADDVLIEHEAEQAHLYEAIHLYMRANVYDGVD